MQGAERTGPGERRELPDIVDFEERPAQHANVRAYRLADGAVRTVPAEEAAADLRALREERRGTRKEGAPRLWIDVVSPGPAEAAFMRDELRLHPLAVEDCLRGRQRPKLDRYAGYLFLVLYAARVNVERGRAVFNELHVFVGDGFIVTVHDQSVEEVRETIARWRAAIDRFPNTSMLAHALLDALVDDYFPVLDHFADDVSSAETQLAASAFSVSIQQIHLLRRELILFRRVVAPLRDMLSRLMRRDLAQVSPDLLPYFEDVRDHVIRLTEEIDTLRELVASLVEGQATAEAQELNKTMRMMTAWSIILMSMAVVAGIYGMNFRFMPELVWRWGYFLALGVMALIGVALGVFFRRKGWI